MCDNYLKCFSLFSRTKKKKQIKRFNKFTRFKIEIFSRKYFHKKISSVKLNFTQCDCTPKIPPI